MKNFIVKSFQHFQNDVDREYDRIWNTDSNRSGKEEHNLIAAEALETVINAYQRLFKLEFVQITERFVIFRSIE